MEVTSPHEPLARGALQQPQAEYVRPIIKTADKKRRKWQRAAAQRELSDTSTTLQKPPFFKS